MGWPYASETFADDDLFTPNEVRALYGDVAACLRRGVDRENVEQRALIRDNLGLDVVFRVAQTNEEVSETYQVPASVAGVGMFQVASTYLDCEDGLLSVSGQLSVERSVGENARTTVLLAIDGAVRATRQPSRAHGFGVQSVSWCGPVQAGRHRAALLLAVVEPFRDITGVPTTIEVSVSAVGLSIVGMGR
jgi:hypothetical protein